MANISEMRNDLDKVSIDQVHKVVLHLSSNCFELKKLCATILISFGTLVSIFTEKTLDSSIFVGAIIIIVFFWVLDSQSYYYQQKLRNTMKDIAETMFARNQANIIIDGVGVPVLSARQRREVLNSLFNNSMLYYLLLVIIIVLLSILFHYSLIS